VDRHHPHDRRGVDRHGLRLHRRPRRNRDPGAGRHVPRAPRPRAGPPRHRADLDPLLVGAALPRLRRSHPPGAGDTGRRPVGHPGSAGGRAALSPAGRRARPHPCLRQRHQRAPRRRAPPRPDAWLPRPGLPGRQDEGRARQPGGGRRASGRGPAARRARGPPDARRQPEVDRGRGHPAGADARAVQPVLAGGAGAGRRSRRALPGPGGRGHSPGGRRDHVHAVRVRRLPAGRRPRRRPGRHRAGGRLHRVAQDRQARRELQPAGRASLRDGAVDPRAVRRAERADPGGSPGRIAHRPGAPGGAHPGRARRDGPPPPRATASCSTTRRFAATRSPASRPTWRRRGAERRPRQRVRQSGRGPRGVAR
jgi:hypothetical protein